jgi:pimeloyl-ACP methyl ester carboxylesterase
MYVNDKGCEMTTITSTSFESAGTTCAAWITPGHGNGPLPGVVLVHGFGATHGMKLNQYEHAFAEAGITVLSFDFRHLGASGGEPRQVISMKRHLQDVDSAWRHLRSWPGVDPTRVGLWGTSLGAMHVLRYAARQRAVAAVVVQCPIVHGPAAALGSGTGHMIGLAPSVLSDAFRALARRPRRYISIVGEPGQRAMVTTPGAHAGWHSVIPAGYRFDNRVAAAAGLEMLACSAVRGATRIACPLLVCVSDRESLMNPRHATRVAERAPRGTATHYDADHFDVYHPPLVDQILDDQTTFLRTALSHRAQEPADA